MEYHKKMTKMEIKLPKSIMILFYSYSRMTMAMIVQLHKYQEKSTLFLLHIYNNIRKRNKSL